MLILNTDKYKHIIFICPKTGSWSLRHLLYSNFDIRQIDISDYKGETGCYEIFDKTKHYRDFVVHMGPSEGLQLLKNKIDVNDYIKIGFVRQHLDRLLSIYNFDNLDENFYEKYDPEYNINSQRPTFNDYLIKIRNKEMYNNTFYNLDRYYLSENNELLTDKLYNFHNFAEEIKTLFLDEFKIHLSSGEIPHYHKTENTVIDYNEELLEKSIIYDLYLSKKNILTKYIIQ